MKPYQFFTALLYLPWIISSPGICLIAMSQQIEIEVIREAGDPVSIADLKPKTEIDDEQNAETYLRGIADDANLLYEKIGAYIHTNDFNWIDKLSKEQIQVVKKCFEAEPEVFSMLKKAADCKTYVSPLDYSVKSNEFVDQVILVVQDRRTMARLHDCRSKYLASTGKPDEAAMTYLQLLRLARLQENEPLLISLLANLAIRSSAASGLSGLSGLMQTADLKQETYEAIDVELAKQDSLDCFTHVLKTERAFGIDTFQNSFFKNSADWKRYLAYMGLQIEAGAKSKFEIVEAIEDPRRGLAGGVVPAIQASRGALNRIRANVRCLRILNAIHWRTMRAAEVEFADLRLPKEIQIDPYNGLPLIMKPTDDGWIVYSVGGNEEDDGGILDGITDVGVGPPQNAE